MHSSTNKNKQKDDFFFGTKAEGNFLPFTPDKMVHGMKFPSRNYEMETDY